MIELYLEVSTARDIQEFVNGRRQWSYIPKSVLDEVRLIELDENGEKETVCRIGLFNNIPHIYYLAYYLALYYR